jgi:hypothetical protein
MLRTDDMEEKMPPFQNARVVAVGSFDPDTAAVDMLL